ncbi:hypothetical protein ACWDUN_15300 [Mycobacterium sp. NPDC003323]
MGPATLVRQVTVALTALLATACSTATSGGPRPPEDAPVVLIDRQIPWSQVGTGWTLASVAESADASLLTLVSPAGDRHQITRLPGPSRLADWSGDGRRALFSAGDYELGTTMLTEIDMSTGATQTITVEGRITARYTRPSGKALFIADDDGRTLRRVDLTGVEQLSYPTDRLGAAGRYNGHHLASIDGTVLVLGADNGLAVMGNNGRLRDHLPVPGPHTDCVPVRWWSSGAVLARCSNADSVGTQLWQVPLDGVAPTAVTDFKSGRRDDYGDIAAWRLPAGSVVQSLGACGASHLSRVTPDRVTEPLRVPGVDASRSVVVVGASGRTLLLRVTESCGPGIALLAYDPAIDDVRVLLGPPVTDSGVSAALAFGDDR